MLLQACTIASCLVRMYTTRLLVLSTEKVTLGNNSEKRNGYVHIFSRKRLARKWLETFFNVLMTILILLCTPFSIYMIYFITYVVQPLFTLLVHNVFALFLLTN